MPISKTTDYQHSPHDSPRVPPMISSVVMRTDPFAAQALDDPPAMEIRLFHGHQLDGISLNAKLHLGVQLNI